MRESNPDVRFESCSQWHGYWLVGDWHTFLCNAGEGGCEQ